MNTQKYKKQLLEERNRLKSLITEMQDNTLFGDTTNHTSERYTSGELSSYDNHPADIGTDVYMQDMQNSLTIHEESRLDKVEIALSKIENGTYGICEQCKNNVITTEGNCLITLDNCEYQINSDDNLECLKCD